MTMVEKLNIDFNKKLILLKKYMNGMETYLNNYKKYVIHPEHFYQLFINVDVSSDYFDDTFLSIMYDHAELPTKRLTNEIISILKYNVQTLKIFCNISNNTSKTFYDFRN
eukprot:UN29699